MSDEDQGHVLPDKFDRIGYRLDAVRVVPTIGLAGYGIFAWLVGSWFMDLKEPNTAQGMFVSTVFGVAPLALNFYMQHATNWTERINALRALLGK